jgi:hypothetical protein
MSGSLLAVIVDSQDPLRLAGFWAEALDYEIAEQNAGEVRVSKPGAGPILYFMPVPEPRRAENRLHLEVLTTGAMADEVARLTAAGAQVVEVRHDPPTYDNPESWTVMRDPEGNEFWVTSTSTLTGLG